MVYEMIELIITNRKTVLKNVRILIIVTNGNCHPLLVCARRKALSTRKTKYDGKKKEAVKRARDDEC